MTLPEVAENLRMPLCADTFENQEQQLCDTVLHCRHIKEVIERFEADPDFTLRERIETAARGFADDHRYCHPCRVRMVDELLREALNPPKKKEGT